MPTIGILFALAIPAIVYVTMPGPAVLYIISQGIRQGRPAGITAVLGVDTGTIIHVLLIALGLGAVLSSSSLAFNVVRFGGAAYLIWLGLSKLASRDAPACVIPGAPPTRLRTIWARGFGIQLVNPALFLFLLALIPQFVDQAAGQSTQQLLVLGLVFVAIELAVESSYALGSGSVAAWLGRHPRANLYCGRFSAAMYLLFGSLAGISALVS